MFKNVGWGDKCKYVCGLKKFGQITLKFFLCFSELKTQFRVWNLKTNFEFRMLRKFSKIQKVWISYLIKTSELTYLGKDLIFGKNFKTVKK